MYIIGQEIAGSIAVSNYTEKQLERICNMEQAKIYIKGMTCRNCETRIANMLKGCKGITKVSVKVSYEDSTVEFSYNPKQITLDTVMEQIEDLGYEALSVGQQQKELILQAVREVLIIAIIFVLLQHFGVLNRLAPGTLAETGMGYGMLFVIGLITSVHCIAMCGGINLSQTLQQKAEKHAGKEMFGNALAYNAGRVVSYTLIGGVLGAVGSLAGIGDSLQTSTSIQGIVKIAAGLIMVIMGINMLGFIPGLRRFGIHIPARKKKRTSKNRKRIPFVVGLCNGCMPCGPLQSMQIVALASSGFVSGAFSMFCFSMGTVPLMLGLGSAVSVLGQKFTRQVMRIGAMLVVVMGLAMISQGNALSGVGRQLAGTVSENETEEDTSTQDVMMIQSEKDATTQAETTQEDGEVQYVTSTLEAGSYPDITVKEGIPVVWTIEAPVGTVNGCNYKILLQDFGEEITLDEGENVVEFTPTKTGTYSYYCWMGMIQGNIYVED